MIQGYVPNLNLTRENLFELGRKGPYFRYADFPLEIATEIELMTKLQVVKPPHHENYRPNDLTVFLAGSIEMGAAEPWQDRLTYLLQNIDNLTLFNPRRDDWDSSWKQSKDNPQFYEQVHWEMDKMYNADAVVFYFDPATRSPVTLMELGFVLGTRDGEDDRDKQVIVCCPEGFWRKGNIDIVCDHYGVKQVDKLDDLADEIVQLVIQNDKYKDKTNETRT